MSNPKWPAPDKPKREMRQILTDADGRDYFQITGFIGERWIYRVAEQPAKRWLVEYWNGQQWTEVVTLPVSDYPAEEAAIAANKILWGWDPRVEPPQPDNTRPTDPPA